MTKRLDRYQGRLAEVEKYVSQPRTTEQTQTLIKLVEQIAVGFSPDLPELSPDEPELRIRTAYVSILGKLRSTAEDLKRRLREENTHISHATIEAPRTGKIQPASSTESGEVVLERLQSEYLKVFFGDYLSGAREATRQGLEALDKKILRDLPTIVGVPADTNTIEKVIELLDSLPRVRSWATSVSRQSRKLK